MILIASATICCSIITEQSCPRKRQLSSESNFTNSIKLQMRWYIQDYRRWIVWYFRNEIDATLYSCYLALYPCHKKILRLKSQNICALHHQNSGVVHQRHWNRHYHRMEYHRYYRFHFQYDRQHMYALHLVSDWASLCTTLAERL